MAAAEVAKSASIGVTIWVMAIASKDLVCLETTIVEPGRISESLEKSLLFITLASPLGNITRIPPLSA